MWLERIHWRGEAATVTVGSGEGPCTCREGRPAPGQGSGEVSAGGPRAVGRLTHSVNRWPDEARPGSRGPGESYLAT